MALLLMMWLLALAWASGAIALHARGDRLRALPLWLLAVWALAVGVVLVWGASGLFRFGDWDALSTGQALHRMFGEGSLALRRPAWAWLNRANGVYLNLDVVWTLLVLCAVQFHSAAFWAGVAKRQRRARARSRG
ncbi:MAG: hypothetical protein ABW163_11080 [Luteimonas sp.]